VDDGSAVASLKHRNGRPRGAAAGNKKALRRLKFRLDRPSVRRLRLCPDGGVVEISRIPGAPCRRSFVQSLAIYLIYTRRKKSWANDLTSRSRAKRGSATFAPRERSDIPLSLSFFPSSPLVSSLSSFYLSMESGERRGGDTIKILLHLLPR